MDAPFLRPFRTAVALVALLVVVAACGTPAARVTVPPDATSSILPAATGTPTPPSPSAAPAFPVTLTDDDGTEITIAKEPARIISLTPATTEILFTLGVGDRVVGKVEDLSLYPPEAASIPDVAKFGSVDIERVVALEPDLVVAGGNSFTPPDAVEKLRAVGVPVLVVYAPTVDQVFADIDLTGRAVGREKEARDLTASIRAEFDRIAAATAGLDHPRVFYEIDASGAIYGPADDSFLAQMIQLAGGEPITTGSPDKFDIPLERLIQQDPEVILLGDAAYGVSAKQVGERPGWNVMTAVKSGAIRPIDDVVVTRPGPRIVDGLHALAGALHPELVASSAAPSAAVPVGSRSPAP